MLQHIMQLSITDTNSCVSAVQHIDITLPLGMCTVYDVMLGIVYMLLSCAFNTAIMFVLTLVSSLCVLTVFDFGDVDYSCFFSEIL